MNPDTDYRERIYSRYVSEKLSLAAPPLESHDDAGAHAALQHRLRGWLPEDRNTPVLELGCGPGRVLRWLQSLGFKNLTGVDRSPEQVAQARQLCPGANIIEGDLTSFLAKSHQKYGLIVALDVLEHFRKDELLPLMAGVVQALSPNGRLIAQTPNAESPWGTMHRYHDLTHEVCFDPHSLQHLFALSGLGGFEARECGPVPHGLLSATRFVLWRLIHMGLLAWNLIETGSGGSGVYTRVFVASARRS
ncbi:MAG: class I SAM-dependent methyltransferase [Myxococcaceae bacterium]